MELSGRVKNIIFKNTENGFTVFVLKNDDGNIVCNGTFENLKKMNMWFWKENILYIKNMEDNLRPFLWELQMIYWYMI